jgi:hypothetical protein
MVALGIAVPFWSLTTTSERVKLEVPVAPEAAVMW